MKKNYYCDVEYRVVSLKTSYYHKPEEVLNNYAKKGFHVMGLNNDIAIMVRETYSEKTESKHNNGDKDTFFGYETEILNVTPNICEATLYLPSCLSILRANDLKEKYEAYLKKIYHTEPKVKIEYEDEDEENKDHL